MLKRKMNLLIWSNAFNTRSERDGEENGGALQLINEYSKACCSVSRSVSMSKCGVCL